MLPNTAELRVEITDAGDGVTVRFPPHTTLSEANADQFGRRMQELCAGRDRPKLVLDLGGVEFLSSVILSKLIALNGRVRAAGGHLTLCNPTRDVQQVFRITRLDTVLEVCSA